MNYLINFNFFVRRPLSFSKVTKYIPAAKSLVGISSSVVGVVICFCQRIFPEIVVSLIWKGGSMLSFNNRYVLPGKEGFGESMKFSAFLDSTD